MQINGLDWAIIVFFLALPLIIGAMVARQAGKSSNEFFLSGRHMPWWLLGFSMVATTFSADTPNLVTDIVRKGGIAGNWVWWAFLLTGMLTVFIYAKLWRRSGVMTDVEFYELRYSGKQAAFLRGFRAIYLGLFFNILIMASVCLAAIKIGGVVIGLSPLQCVLIAGSVAVAFSAIGGLKAVLLSDFILFIIAMIGSCAAAYFSINHADIGNMNTLFTHENVSNKLSFFPKLIPAEGGGYTPESMNVLISVLIIPIAVQWWSVWYPGSEPGGGGFVAQRMLAAKDEKHAMGAVLFFNAAHYALRPWPWIIVALCSMIVYPNVESLQEAFPHIPADKVDDDLAYPAMLSFLPAGWMGLVIASLVAAFMSTISTLLNWGSSYIVNDFYKRFMNPEASEKKLVSVGRITTVLMMVVAAFLALNLDSALQSFNILLQVGAGTGLLFILRWFWWRINAMCELVAMVVSFIVALVFFKNDFGLESWQQLLLGVGATTLTWLIAAFVTKPTDKETLYSFCRLTNPGGPGWNKIYTEAEEAGSPIEVHETPINLPSGILCMVLACMAVYCALFSTGFFLYGNLGFGVLLALVAIVSTVLLIMLWNKVAASELEDK